ncbi:MAG: hypothetical protein BWY33_01908 [Candidatus Dependentiae bacterium ADurb.Bin246]|nr:MAG: hypothetical protein BWY33_01908 [Candidatus Dependentiae bacterium ADurb.Bin246]
MKLLKCLSLSLFLSIIISSCGGASFSDIAISQMYISLHSGDFEQAKSAFNKVDKNYKFYTQLDEINQLISNNDFILAEEKFVTILKTDNELKSTLDKVAGRVVNINEKQESDGLIKIGNRLFTGVKIYSTQSSDSYIGTISCYGIYIMPDKTTMNAVFIKYPSGKVEPKYRHVVRDWFCKLDDPAIQNKEYKKCE